MIQVKGHIISDTSWISALEVVDVLCYYDGPLVSIVKDSKGDTYVKVWCDCETNSDRCFLIKATPTEINKYEPDHAKAIIELLTSPTCPDLIITDEVWKDGQVTLTAKVILPSDFPSQYMPTP